MHRSRSAEPPAVTGPQPPGAGPAVASWSGERRNTATGPVRHIVDLPPDAELASGTASVWDAARRRAVGLALLLAVLLGLTGVAASRPRPTAGQGSASPATALPADGSCLRWSVDPAAPLTPTAGTVAVVDCRQMHQGQVLSTWRPGTLDRAAESDRCPRVSAVWEAGHPAADRAEADWSLPVVTRSNIVVADGTTLLDFTACTSILRWDSGRYSLLGIDRALVVDRGQQAADLPADATISWCLDEQRRSTGCQQPHTFERVGVFSTDGARVTPTSTCQDRARAVIGSEGAVSGIPGPGALTTSVGATTEETLGGSANVTFLLCDVIAPRGRQLVDTVVGWGERPLPLR